MSWLEDARQDTRLGIRLLRRSPLFTLTAALSLAVGIGANTAIFTVANSLLLRPPPGIAAPEQLVDIGALRGDFGLNPIPLDTYRELARTVTACTALFAIELFPHPMSVRLPDAVEPERLTGQAVTANFFEVLGAQPHLGRLFDPGDGAAATAAVLDYQYWMSRLGGDRQILGRALRVNERLVTIVGITAAGFQGIGLDRRDLWLIFPPSARSTVVVGGRLTGDASVAQAAGQAAALAGTDSTRRLTALPYSRAGGNRNVIAGFTGVLMVLVTLVLGVACANIAGLMIARAHGRAREMSLRTALGAGRGRLARQLLAEIVTLCLVGGAAGGALAWGLVAAFPAISPLPLPPVPLSIDVRVLLFALGLSLAAALLAGLWPAWKGSRTAPASVLKEDSRSSSGRSRARVVFVTGQIALSVLLVVLAAFFVRALVHAGAVAPGFDPQRVELTTIDLTMSSAAQSSPDRVWSDAIERVRRLPGVEAAALARVPPGGWEGIGLGVFEGPIQPSWNIVSPGYFAALRIPLLGGRDFSDADTAGSPPVAIVADTLARKLWPGQPAVGQLVTIDKRRAQIVGVAGDITSSSLIDGLAEPYLYLPVAQSAHTKMTTTLTIVTRHRAGAAPSQVEAAVRETDPVLVAAAATTLVDAIHLGMAPQRLLALVAGSLGLVALVLAAIGIYGLMAYMVARRRQEFGIRIALGASRASIQAMVWRQGFWILAPGSAVGLLLASGASQVLSVFLYGLPVLHMPTMAGTLALVGLFGGLACYLPARRVTRLEPARALQAS